MYHLLLLGSGLSLSVWPTPPNIEYNTVATKGRRSVDMPHRKVDTALGIKKRRKANALLYFTGTVLYPGTGRRARPIAYYSGYGCLELYNK